MKEHNIKADDVKEIIVEVIARAAVARVIAEGTVRTYDVGGKATTIEMAKAVADYAS